MELQMQEINFLISLAWADSGVGGLKRARTHPQHFSIFSIGSPTSKEIRKLMSFIRYSMYLESVSNLFQIQTFNLGLAS